MSAQHSATSNRVPGAPRPRMVLAEDDHEVRTALAHVFALDGFDVVTASTGDELVRVLEQARDADELPYVIVTDHRMPGFSGIEITRALRDNGWPVPIILITAYGREAMELGYDAGADAVFSKPLDIDDLRTTVWDWLESRGRPTTH